MDPGDIDIPPRALPRQIYQAPQAVRRRGLNSSARREKSLRLARMYGVDKFTDCTVCVGPAEASETFRANRVLLARCSDVLGHMLQKESSAEVRIPDCTGEAFKELVRCSYDIGPEIKATNFVDVFRLAQRYDVEDLREAVTDWIGNALANPALALRAVDAAQARGVTTRRGGAPGSSSDDAGVSGNAARVEEELFHMLEGCLHSAAMRAEGLLDDGALFGCSAATVSLLVQQENLCCDEEHLWCSLMHWAGDQGGRDALRSVLPHVRFNIMSSDFFVDDVVPAGVLEPVEVMELLSSRATGRPTPSFPDAALPRRRSSACAARLPCAGSRWEALGEDDSSFGEDDLASARGAPDWPTGRSSGSATPSAAPSGLLQAEQRAAAHAGASAGYPPAVGDSRQPSTRQRSLREAREAHRSGSTTSAPAAASAAPATRRTSKRV